MIRKFESSFQFLLDFTQKSAARRTFVLVILALALLVPGLSAIPVLDRDEGRFLQASKQMVETGDFIDIRFQNEPRWRKPIAIYWLQAGALQLSGKGANAAHWVYRMPSLGAGILSVLLTCWAFSPLIGRRAATLAAAMLGTTFLWMVESHIGKTDIVLLACVILAHGALLRILVREATTPVPFSAMHLLFWASIGFGILVKGPIILIVTSGILMWWMYSKRSVEPLRQIRPLRGMIIVLAVAAPWFVAITIRSGGAFWTEALVGDLLGKVNSVQERHFGFPGYYLVSLWFTFFPWMPLFILAIPDLWRDRRSQNMRILLGWSVPFWLLFAFFPTKLVHYMLPILPALCAMLAGWLVSLKGLSGGSLSRWSAAVLFALTGVFLASLNVVAVPFFEGVYPVIGMLAGLAAVPFVVLGAAALVHGRPAGFGAAAVCVTLLVFPALMQITLPSLHSFFLTPRLVALWSKFEPCADTPLVSAGYHEPSLVFEAGTDTLLASFEDAEDLLKGGEGHLAFLETRDGRTGIEMLASGGSVRILGEVSGTNYNRGGKSTIFLVANTGNAAFEACLDANSGTNQ